MKIAMKRQVIVGGSGYYNQDGSTGPSLDTSMCFGNTGISCNAGSFNLSDIFGGSGDSTTNVRVPDYITPLDTSAPVSLPKTIEDDAAKAYTLTADELKSLFTQGYAQPSNNAENDAGGGGKSAVAGSAKDAAALAALFKPAAAAAAPAGAKVAQNPAPCAAAPVAPSAPATPWGTIALVAGGGLLMCVLIIVVANRA